MKTCITCKESKNESEFAIKNKMRGTLNSSCKQCHRIYSVEHYKNNRLHYIQKSKKRNDGVANENRQFIIKHLLEHPCVDCGETDIVVLTFDHVNGKKKHNVSQMLRYGIKSIQEEMCKCVIRCHNCHIRRHAKENKWKRII